MGGSWGSLGGSRTVSPPSPPPRASLATRAQPCNTTGRCHTPAAPLRTPATMGYFLYRIVRGARIFEQTSLLELRFSPYLRTDPSLDVPQRIAAMAAVVEAIAAGAKVPEYAVDVRLVLCLHTLVPDAI